MPTRDNPNRWGMTRTEITAAYAADRENELLDAVLIAAALVARSDGGVAAVERGELLDVLDRKGFLAVFTHREILAAFECRLSHVADDGGAAIDALRRLAPQVPTGLVIAVAEHVAAADRHIHPLERQALALIRTTVTRSLAS